MEELVSVCCGQTSKTFHIKHSLNPLPFVLTGVVGLETITFVVMEKS
jgi:hypothetical protein